MSDHRAGSLVSACPATGEIVWEGSVTSPDEVHRAVESARAALPGWSDLPLSERIEVAQAFAGSLRAEAELLVRTIARETGKPLWEARGEVSSMIGKVAVSIAAQAERAGTRERHTDFGSARLSHRPHGVMVVPGPFNFPGHLPNGHIVPALLAGNTVVFKPSEHTPATGELMAKLWAGAGLPGGVLQIVQGSRETGQALVEADIDGLLFTGSAATGRVLRRVMADRPGVILALELGGNNPLVAWDGEPEALATQIALSAFVTTGQRCSCARRLIVPQGAFGEAVIEATAAIARRMRIGAWNDEPEPAMGPLISAAAAAQAKIQVGRILEAGARPVLPFAQPQGRSDAFVTPALLDVTGCEVADEEIFAPVLQIVRVPDFAAAIAAANDTAFGLSAGLLSADEDLWQTFRRRIRAGVVNRNRPTTGAAADLPFGGLGESGNHRPSAYYAADYCAYPVASFSAPTPLNLIAEMRGLA